MRPVRILALTLLLAAVARGEGGGATGSPVRFDAEPLGVAIERLRAATGAATARADWDALAAAGVTPETPVTLRLPRGLPAGEAFGLLADAAGAAIVPDGGPAIVPRDHPEAQRTATLFVGDLSPASHDTMTLPRFAEHEADASAAYESGGWLVVTAPAEGVDYLRRFVETARRAPPPIDPRDPPAALPVTADLDRPLSAPVVGRMPLREALDRIGRSAGLLVVADYGEMELEGVDAETVIEANVPAGTPAWLAFEHVLADAADGFAELEAATDGRAVRVTTADAAADLAVTRLYDVLPIVEAMAARPAGRWGNDYDDLIEDVIQLILDLAVSDSWKQNGGRTGAIAELNGVLVVTQNERGHRAVVDTLRLIAETFGADPPEPADVPR